MLDIYVGIAYGCGRGVVCLGGAWASGGRGKEIGLQGGQRLLTCTAHRPLLSTIPNKLTESATDAPATEIEAKRPNSLI